MASAPVDPSVADGVLCNCDSRLHRDFRSLFGGNGENIVMAEATTRWDLQ